MLDLLLQNGSYPDFESGRMTRADIGIENGRIAYIGTNAPEARERIDVSGRVVSPGFIDIHMHEEDFDRDGRRYFIANHMLAMGVTTVCGGNCGHSRQPLRVFKKTLRELGGAPVNYTMQTGYNVLRTQDGLGPHDPSTQEQRERYRRRLAEELQEGANGISFGVEYDPAITYEEMLFAATASDDPNHFVSIHYRKDDIKNIDSVREMVRLSRDIRQRLQISHLSSCSAYGHMEKALELINSAMETDPGLDYDTYPYNAFSCSIGSTVFDEGCLENWGRDYSDILLTGEPYRYVRCTEEIFRDARENHPAMLAVAFSMREEEIRLAVKDRRGIIASDGLLRGGSGHPRAAGTFPRVLGRYVREAGELSLMEALRKMTLAPADRLRLFQKGRIRLDCDADITVFDPKTIIDRADFGDLEPPEGIEYVLIGGEVAMEKGRAVNRRLGRFIPFR